MAHIQTVTNASQPSAKAGGCPPEVSLPNQKWFVMRVTYSRELRAQTLLQDAGVFCYIPMRIEWTEKGEQCVPAVHNLLFVRTSREFMDDYKRKVEDVCPLRYMMDRSTGLPMVVRDKEMEDFMRVTENRENDIKYLDDPNATATKGTPIEVMVGPYKGIRGKLLRIRKDRKVVLQLEGVVAIALSGIPMEHLRVIEG